MRPGPWSFVLLVDSLMFMDHVLSWWASMRGLRCDVYALSVERESCAVVHRPYVAHVPTTSLLYFWHNNQKEHAKTANGTHERPAKATIHGRVLKSV